MPVNKVEAKNYIKKPTIHETEVRPTERSPLGMHQDSMTASKPSPFMDSILENKDFPRKLTLSKMMKTNGMIESHKKP